MSLVAGPTDRSSSDRPTNEETAIEVLDTIQAADWMVRGNFQAPVDAKCRFCVTMTIQYVDKLTS